MKTLLLKTALAISLLLAPAAMADTSLSEVRHHIEDSAMVVGGLDMETFDFKVFFESISELLGQPANITQSQERVQQVVTELRKHGVTAVHFSMSMRDLQTGPVFLVSFDGKLQNAVQIEKTMKRLAKDMMPPIGDGMSAELDGKTLVFGNSNAVSRIMGKNPNGRQTKKITDERLQEIGTALASAGDVGLRVAFSPSPETRFALEQTVPAFPGPFAKFSIADVLDGAQWASVGVGTKGGPTIKVKLQSKDEAAASKMSQLLELLGTGFSERANMSFGPGHQQEVASVLKLLTPKQDSSQLATTITANEFAQIHQLLLQPMQQAASRTRLANNLKQIALAMLNFESAYRAYPPHASYDDDGKPMLSWRVYVLPFLEEQQLYEKFHLDEPWDSEHNRALIKEMPQVFKNLTGKVEAGKTTLQVPYGKSTIFFGKNGTKLRNVLDGTSKTLLCVDVAPEKAVIWTSPEDWTVDMNAPYDGLLGDRKGFQACRCDGSVSLFEKKEIDEKTMRAMLTKDGGEVY